MWTGYALLGFALVLACGYWFIRRQSKQIAEQKQQIAEQTQQIEQIKAEAKAIAEEMDNAQQGKKIEQTNRRLNAHGIDEQLQSKGYFRED